jgi:uroporphyrinogen III methyltransferase/synthase
LLERLEDLGAEAIEAPFIKVAPLTDTAPLDAAIDKAGQYDWIVFTGATTVEHFMRRLRPGRTTSAASRARICAVGLVTAERLSRSGLGRPHPSRTTAAIVEGMKGRLRWRASCSREPTARDLIAEELRAPARRWMRWAPTA